MVDRGPWEDYEPPDYYDGEEEPQPPPLPRDPEIDTAKRLVMEKLFNEEAAGIYYQRQIVVLLESEVFHWITAKAVRELGQEGAVMPHSETLSDGLKVNFFIRKGLRYWRREVKRIGGIIAEYSALSRAIGFQAEMLFDGALGAVGFRTLSRDTRSYDGKEWTESDHNLDRIIERDSVVYGVEIKNALEYIPRDELQLKLKMCGLLGLRSLFIMRAAAKSYVEEVRREGGFTLIFGRQLYPFGHDELVVKVKNLGLPVDCPKRVPDGHIERFLKWHEAHRSASEG